MLSSSKSVPQNSLCSAVPRLLVSVRSWQEAMLALKGGAEILDVKEPARGSLGMADSSVIDSIAENHSLTPVVAHQKALPLSVALGEVRDWIGIQDAPRLPSLVEFAKLGLAGLGLNPDWEMDWKRVRESFDDRRTQPLRWVAVAYADHRSAVSPTLDAVLDAALASDCAGLLIDTYAKSALTLMDSVSKPDLQRVVTRCHDSGLFLAIAGRLTMAGIAELRDVAPDIIAIRSAACLNSDRSQSVDSGRVALFRQAIREQWG